MTQQEKDGCTFLMLIGLFLLAGCFAVYFVAKCCTNKWATERKAEMENCRSNTIYSFQHPEIIGTNELGQTIKKYTIHDPYRNQEIYQIGSTKTSIIDHGKFGLETHVNDE